MVRKYKFPLLILTLLAAGALVIHYGNKSHYGISEGTYRMVTEKDSQLQPLIHFYRNGTDVRFVFSADERISFSCRGHVKLDGRVNAYCENSGEVMIFEVVDNERIRFVEKGSSDILLKEQPLPDGAIFQYEK